MWHACFDRVPHAAEVDVDHVLPDGFPDLVQHSAVGADTGVGDDDVETTELFDAAVHRGLARFEVRHVDLSRDDAPVETLDQIRCLVEVFRRCMRVAEVVDRPADVDGDDVGALFSQPDGVTSGLPSGCPTDERDLALDATGHGVEAGIDSHPRTVDVGLSLAFDKSTSHSGKRLRISSMAIRPSSRASAEPRQKWVPTLKARCCRGVRWMLNSSLSEPNWRGSRQAAPISIIITAPSGTVWPWKLMSRVT